MSKSNSIRRGRRCVFSLQVHLVFLTKYRFDVLTEAALDDLRGIFSKICEDFHAEVLEFGGASDHVCLRVTYPPATSVSQLVNSLKGASSHRIRRMHPDVAQRCWNGSLWSPSYLAGSGEGAPIERLKKQYIEEHTGSAPEAGEW